MDRPSGRPFSFNLGGSSRHGKRSTVALPAALSFDMPLI
jgi:hypothetical protein